MRILLAMLIGLAACGGEPRPEAPHESAPPLVLCPPASRFVPGVGCVGDVPGVEDAGSANDVDAAPPRVRRAKATLFLDTPGARVLLVSGADRREVPMMPITIEMDTSKVWTIEASKPGYADFRQEIRFDDGASEKTYHIELKPR